MLSTRWASGQVTSTPSAQWEKTAWHALALSVSQPTSTSADANAFDHRRPRGRDQAGVVSTPD
jgi:hypothetical protein